MVTGSLLLVGGMRKHKIGVRTRNTTSYKDTEILACRQKGNGKLQRGRICDLSGTERKFLCSRHRFQDLSRSTLSTNAMKLEWANRYQE
jgi:hypothetical protein